MARPRKDKGEKRTEWLPSPRATAAELAYIESAAKVAGKSVSAYMRDCALSGGMSIRAERSKGLIQFLSGAIAALNRIGNNINQIARQLNRGREHDPHHLEEVLEELLTLTQKIGERF